MNTKLLLIVIPLAIGLLLGTRPGCRPAQAALPGLPGSRADLDLPEGFWWTFLGEQSAAAADFGGGYATQAGVFRHWTLVIHLPGSSEPLSCLEGVVSLEDATPIRAQGASFTVELSPKDGRLWGEVLVEEDCTARIEGLY